MGSDLLDVAGEEHGSALPASHALAGTLDALERHLPRDLVESRMLAAVRRVTARLPAALTQRLYLECRLQHGAPAVDLVFCVDEVGRERLRDRPPGWLPPALRTHPIWTGLARLCSAWADAASPLHRLVYDVWLEFDVGNGSAGDAALVPNVFIGFTANRAAPRHELWSAAQLSLELLQGRPMQPAIRSATEECLLELPPEATLAYVGCMYPRGDPDALRLCVAPLGGQTLTDYLGQIRWPGSLDEVERTFLALSASPVRTTLLHVDVRETVQPRISIELAMEQRPQLGRRGVVEQQLLERLCDLDLCAGAKRDALLRWPGHTVEVLPHQCWPSLMLRRVSHVKLVFEPGCRPVAKTYLSVFHGSATHRAAVTDR